MSGIVYCEKISDSLSGHLVVIDGKSAMIGADFLRCIGEQMKFPAFQKPNWDAYLDWMRDLSWLDTKSVSVIISNFDSFLSEEPDSLEYFLSDLTDVIFPFWQNDAERVFESHDAVKDITVYCVRGGLLSDEEAGTKDILCAIRQYVLDGQKTLHSISQPVLRFHEEKLCLAVFVFFYNKQQLQSALVNRPAMWAVCDLTTGEIVQQYLCQDNDFSGCTHQKLYDISMKSVQSVGQAYWESVYALMDLIRHDYIRHKTLNRMLYREYFNRILYMTPAEYQVFYKDLNGIDIET